MTPRTGDPITGADEPGDLGERAAYVLHAGTKRDGDGLVSAGGRVLCTVGLGSDLQAARAAAYSRIAQIDLPGGHFRRDIALAAAHGDIHVSG